MIDAVGVPAVPAVSHPQPGHLFDGLRGSFARSGGVSRLSRLKTKLSRVRKRVRTHTPVIVFLYSRDSRDTPPETVENGNHRDSAPVEGVPAPAGTPRDTPGHPASEVAA